MTLWELLEGDRGNRIQTRAARRRIRSHLRLRAHTDRVTSIRAQRGTTDLQHLTYQYYVNGLGPRTPGRVRDGSAPRNVHLRPAAPPSGPQSRGPDCHHLRVRSNRKPETRRPKTFTPVAGRPQLAQTIGQTTYAYNTNGNQTSLPGSAVPSGTQTYTYNAFDMPRTITAGTGASAITVDLEYGAGQERVVKRVNNPGATGRT